jgi:hypothetical protein
MLDHAIVKIKRSEGLWRPWEESWGSLAVRTAPVLEENQEVEEIFGGIGGLRASHGREAGLTQ